MLASRLRRTFATLAVLAAVSACSQNPQFRMDMANEAYESLDTLYVLLAKADLGALRSPSSYPGEVDSYATIIGGFDLGRLLTAGRPSGKGGAASLDHVDATIGQCVGEIRRMSDVHRSKGIAPGSDVVRAVRTRCDAAARLVAANEVSSWLFSTAAEDL